MGQMTDIGAERLIIAIGQQALDDIVTYHYYLLENELGEIFYKSRILERAKKDCDDAIRWVYSEDFAGMFPNIAPDVFVREAKERAKERLEEERLKRAKKAAI